MKKTTRTGIALSCFLVAAAANGMTAQARDSKVHRLAIQVSSANPGVMQLALNNAENVLTYYADRQEKARVEIVAFGPGLNMLRVSTSPVKNEIKSLFEQNMGDLRFSACHNTIEKVEKQIGHPVHILPQAKVVPGGVVRLMTLEGRGWAYIDATVK